jgi:hypothetical protein
VNQESVRLFIDSWSSCWTLVLGLGYIGRTLYWPALAALGSEIAAQTMMASSLAVVLVLCLSGFAPAALMIAGWAVALTLLRRTFQSSTD